MKTIKSLIPVLCMLLITVIATAQEDKAKTAMVNEKFNEMYPDVQVEKWENKNDRYEVEFNSDNLKHRAHFAADGTWLYKERDISMNEIPKKTLLAFRNSQWAAWKVEKTQEINSPEHTALYLFKVKREDNRMYLYYHPDGTLQNASSKMIF